MQLSERLRALADFVPMGSKVIDVGTDHGYIPIFLMKTGRAISCLATDINAGPLEKAEKNIKTYRISGITLKQTNGLENIEDNAGDIIMISGMGGYLMMDILKRAPKLVTKAQKLILQPQQDIKEVRQYLHQTGWQIEDETLVYDEGKYYTVICAVHGLEHYNKAYEYLYGKKLIEKGTPLVKKWLLSKSEKLEAIYSTIEEQHSLSAENRKKELVEELKALKEAIDCLN